jgi:hypothetical protein
MRRLIQFEWRKAFLRLPVLVLLVLFTAVDLVKIYGDYQENSYLAMDASWNAAYWDLYEDYSGEITLDKINSLLALYRPLKEQTADLTATSAYGVEGTLTGNIWSDKNMLSRYYVKPMQYCYTYQNLAAQVYLKATENVELFADLGSRYEAAKNERIAALYSGRQIDSFYYTEGWLYYVYYDFSTVLVLLLCLYGLSQVFTREKESGMDHLLPTSRNGGRRTVAAKLIAATLFIAGVSLWFSLVDYVDFSVIFGMGGGAGLPIYAIENLAYASVNLTIWQYAVASALSRALGVWVFGMAVLLVSVFCRHALVPLAAGAAAFVALAMAGAQWNYSSHTWLAALNPYSLVVGRFLYGRTEFVSLFGIPLLSWEAALLCAAAAGLCLIFLIFRFGRGSVLKGGRSA